MPFTKYYTFGGCRNSQGNLGTDKRFTGQRLDDTGPYYYGARYYDPTIGRFISPDNLVQSFTNPQTLNRYSYTINNPLKYFDPTGHLVKFYEGDPNLLTLVWAWEKFMALCPKESGAMMDSDAEYIIATHIDVDSPGYYKSYSQSFGDADLDLPQLILVGTSSINEGINRVTASIIHEELGHLEEGKAGATQLEEFIAWRITSGFAENLGIDDIGNPGGDTEDFWEWTGNLGKTKHIYSQYPVLELSDTDYLQAIDYCVNSIYDYTNALGNYFGSSYIYGETPSDWYWYDWYYWYYLYY